MTTETLADRIFALALRGQLSVLLRDQLWGQFAGQLQDQLWNPIWGQLWDQLQEETR